VYADVDTQAALQLLSETDCKHLLHGHTHKPAQHTLDAQHLRTVLSDWDMNAQPARAEVLRMTLTDSQTKLERLPLSAIAKSRD
jgi:UDP-2,3-diacylglucosamine hydrolase